jgi:hypothetical protein
VEVAASYEPALATASRTLRGEVLALLGDLHTFCGRSLAVFGDPSGRAAAGVPG